MSPNISPTPWRSEDRYPATATHTNPPWEIVPCAADDARNEGWERRAEELIRRDERRRCAAQVRAISDSVKNQRPTDYSLLIEAIARALEAEP